MKPLSKRYAKFLAQKPTSILDTLEKVRRILTPEGNWISGVLYKTTEGYESAEDEAVPQDAAQVCLLGALRLVDGRFEDHAVEYLENIIHKEFQDDYYDTGEKEPLYDDIPDFNDDTDHSEVLRVLGLAIKKLKAKKKALSRKS